MIVMYDLEDNIITVFDSYKECAKYFKTSIECIYSTISRIRKGARDKKRDFKNKRWVRLYMVGDNDEY